MYNKLKDCNYTHIRMYIVFILVIIAFGILFFVAICEFYRNYAFIEDPIERNRQLLVIFKLIFGIMITALGGSLIVFIRMNNCINIVHQNGDSSSIDINCNK